MPGLLPQQVAVNLNDADLSIAARGEEFAPSYSCRVRLPQAVDRAAVVAAYAYGVLVVALPLATPADSPLDALGPGLVRRRVAGERVS
jgi:HSP20 family molecular chaperone IbpA